MASVIHGEWTHRRGDAGGARAVPAEIEKPKPTAAWSWRPEHGGRVDQVRVISECVVVATMMPGDSRAAGWEHAVVYVLEARTGQEIARRVLPDPVPVAAMVLDQGLLHVVGARRGEPIYWYALTATDLVPRHRRVVQLSGDDHPEDVLDAWASPEGDLWLELEVVVGPDRQRKLEYAFAEMADETAPARVFAQDVPSEAPLVSRDACSVGRQLFAPVDGRWEGLAEAVPPMLELLDPLQSKAARAPWARATVVGPRARVRAVATDNAVCAICVAEDHERPDRARVEVFQIDRESHELRWRAQGQRIAIKPQLGFGARVIHRANGEVLFQGLQPDGAPCAPVLCARPDGGLDTVVLGARGRWIVDAALGDLVLSHRDRQDGGVDVAGFAIDHQGRLLGRRAVADWTFDAGDLGAETTVYAGAGMVVVRGLRAVCALRL